MGKRPALARAAALDALRRLESGPVDLGEALRLARDPLSDVRDRALATELVIGTLRWRAALDYQLQRFSRRALHRLDPDVLNALRLGAYQLLHLARVPPRAVVDDAVHLVKAAGLRSAAGFANAVLRQLAGRRDALVWPRRPDAIDSDADHEALIEHLAVVHSHPRWLVERWAGRYGAANAEVWLRFNNEPAPLTLAPNRLRTTRGALAARLVDEGVETAPTRTAPHGLLVVRRRAVSPAAVAEGFALIQDEASQIIAELVRPEPGQRVLDACASPGGKTVALAADCPPPGLVVATDVRRRRMRLLGETLARCGASAVHLTHVDPAAPLPFRDAAFDRVLVDAPCSGLGTLRRDPDIRWRRTAADLAPLAVAQHDLLARVRPLVAPRGRLIYSTCSSEPDENEAVIAAFLRTAPEFAVVPLAGVPGLPGPVAALATAGGHLRTTPLHGLEAFFGAVLERRL